MELLAEGAVAVYYDLTDANAEKKYSLHLYSSIDNYIQPLEKVEGDIGVDLFVGKNKRLVWRAKEELGEDFAGDVALELKGNTYVPFISLDNFDDYKVLKRGKPYDLTWTGGRGDNILNIELYQGDSKIKVFEERPNVGNTSLSIPKDVRPGLYRLKISDSRNRDEVVWTDDFLVRRKMPLGLTAGVGAILIGGGALLINKFTGNSEEKMGWPPYATGN